MANTVRRKRNDGFELNVIIGNIEGKPESNLTPLEKMEMASDGVSKKSLETLKAETGLDYDDLAKALSVTRTTLINKKGKDKFDTSVSERIVGLADIYSYGYEVFGDKDLFKRWMFNPNKAIGGKAPYDLVGSQFGKEEIKDIIGRIEYGVYS